MPLKEAELLSLRGERVVIAGAAQVERLHRGRHRGALGLHQARVDRQALPRKIVVLRPAPGEEGRVEREGGLLFCLVLKGRCLVRKQRGLLHASLSLSPRAAS